MHRKPALLAIVGCLTIVLALASWSMAAPPRASLAHLKFSGTIEKADQQYLGLEKSGAFTLQDIKAPYVLIEIMRTTCPHCVEQVPAVNRLYQLLANSTLKDKVKIIAVGESNHASALKQFKVTHKIPYALVPDPDWKIGTAFNIGGTPTTVVVDKSGQVLFTEDGAFDNAEAVFKKLKSRVK
jgi:thiol-disulfide isomerase/thioredoxin